MSPRRDPYECSYGESNNSFDLNRSSVGGPFICTNDIVKLGPETLADDVITNCSYVRPGFENAQKGDKNYHPNHAVRANGTTSGCWAARDLGQMRERLQKRRAVYLEQNPGARIAAERAQAELARSMPQSHDQHGRRILAPRPSSLEGQTVRDAGSSAGTIGVGTTAPSQSTQPIYRQQQQASCPASDMPPPPRPPQPQLPYLRSSAGLTPSNQQQHSSDPRLVPNLGARSPSYTNSGGPSFVSAQSQHHGGSDPGTVNDSNRASQRSVQPNTHNHSGCSYQGHWIDPDGTIYEP